MSFWISDAFASVWDVSLEDKVALVSLSTSRKDKQTDEYVNSGWGDYNRFVGKAREKANDLHALIPAAKAAGRPVRIKILQAAMSNEPYVKDGEKVWPKRPQLAVFDFEFTDAPNTDSDSDDGDLPF